MGGGDLNLKKSWHPHTMKNQERVWKAEQAKQNEQRKLDDLRKEINEERDREELRRIGETSGVLASSGGNEAKLEWMYKNSNELINREEYLLGRKIDKSFETLQAEERQQQHNALGIKQSINHVEHECVPFSIRQYRNLQSTEQVDMQRKTMEDPLMLIKQREMESRRKLLENPVKLKEIHRILKTEQQLKTAKRSKKTKKSKKSKKKKHSKGSENDDSSSSGTDSDDDLDRKLARQVKKLKEVEGNADLKLDKLLDAKYRSISKQLDMATKQNDNKKSRRRGNSNTSSNSSSENSSSSSEDAPQQRKRGDNSTSRRRSATRQMQSSRGRTRSPRRNQQEMQRRRSRSRSIDRQRHRRQQRSRSGNRERRRSPAPTQSRKPTEQRRRNRSNSPAPTQSRKATEQRPNRSNGKQKLSNTECEARLREMMENASWREADRTQAVQKHRDAYAREEAQHQARDFDKQFINQEVKKAIANQTSIGNRIRANLNNIQRTSSAMDTNFARK